jgi:hypothetical protein
MAILFIANLSGKRGWLPKIELELDPVVAVFCCGTGVTSIFRESNPFWPQSESWKCYSTSIQCSFNSILKRYEEKENQNMSRYVFCVAHFVRQSGGLVWSAMTEEWRLSTLITAFTMNPHLHSDVPYERTVFASDAAVAVVCRGSIARSMFHRSDLICPPIQLQQHVLVLLLRFDYEYPIQLCNPIFDTKW